MSLEQQLPSYLRLMSIHMDQAKKAKYIQARNLMNWPMTLAKMIC